MKKTFSTETAAKRIGVSFRTLNRWLALGKIRPSLVIPLAGGRTLWRWLRANSWMWGSPAQQRSALNLIA